LACGNVAEVTSFCVEWEVKPQLDQSVISRVTVVLSQVSRCHEMRVAELVWTETPAKRPYAWQSVSATWSTSDMRDLMFKRHHRQRHFVRFFDLFTATVPNLVVLSLPFDWSERSLQLLRRLVHLRDVKLSKYFRYAPVNGELFTDTFASLPCLRRLSLELWTESFSGFSYLQLKVPSFCKLKSLSETSNKRLIWSLRPIST